jgi:catechol 2,3-dioxygenase-like lactoylglutathione lyase family enzyme
VSDEDEAERPRTLFTRLVPILYVADLAAERRFYEALGLNVTYEGPEYPDFIALGTEGLEFGLERREDFRPEAAEQVLIWQLGVSDVDEAESFCNEAGFSFEKRTHTPAEGWKYRTLRLRSPNGYLVVLEGPSE